MGWSIGRSFLLPRSRFPNSGISEVIIESRYWHVGCNRESAFRETFPNRAQWVNETSRKNVRPAPFSEGASHPTIDFYDNQLYNSLRSPMATILLYLPSSTLYTFP